MPNEWIIDVLTDLRLFAEQNGLSMLAEQLDDTVLVAATEIASGGVASDRAGLKNGHITRGIFAQLAASDNA